MLYNLTDKLNFNENPKIEVNGKVVEVNADAVTVLKVMDILDNEGETTAMLKAKDLLFSDKDKKTIDKLNLKIDDYFTLVTTALSLALGEDPDGEAPGEK